MSKLKVDEIRSADRSVSSSANITLTDDGNIKIPDGGTIGSASDADAISISSAGHVIHSASPYFSVHGNQGGSGTDVGDNARVPFNQAHNNHGSHFDTSNYYFLTPIAGIYHFRAQLYHYSGSSAIVYDIISQNTSDADTFTMGRLKVTPTGNDTIHFISAITYLAANRRISVYNKCGATRKLYLLSAQTHTVFQGALIG